MIWTQDGIVQAMVGLPDVTPISCSLKHGSIGTSYPSCQGACQWGRLSRDTQSKMCIYAEDTKTKQAIPCEEFTTDDMNLLDCYCVPNGEPGNANRQTKRQNVL